MKDHKWKIALLILLLVSLSITIWRLTHRSGEVFVGGGGDHVDGDYTAVGPGYTAIVEMSSWFPGSRGAEVSGRVLFFSHRYLDLRGIVQTTGDTYVVPSWSGNSFLVAWTAPSNDPATSNLSRIIEFNADENKVTADYVHPRALARLTIAGSPQQQRSPIARGGNHILWLLTELVKEGSVRQQIEAIDWKEKTVKRQQDIPLESTGRVLPLPIESGCVLVINGESKTEARVVFLDAQPADIPLGFEKGEQLRLLDASNNLICGITSHNRVVVIAYSPQVKRGVVRFKNEIFAKGENPLRTFLIPEEELILIGLAPEGKQAVKKILFVSARDGSVVSEGVLEKPAVGISYGDKHIWALCRETFSFTAYDREFRPVRRLPNPLTEIVDLKP